MIAGGSSPRRARRRRSQSARDARERAAARCRGVGVRMHTRALEQVGARRRRARTPRVPAIGWRRRTRAGGPDGASSAATDARLDAADVGDDRVRPRVREQRRGDAARSSATGTASTISRRRAAASAASLADAVDRCRAARATSRFAALRPKPTTSPTSPRLRARPAPSEPPIRPTPAIDDPLEARHQRAPRRRSDAPPAPAMKRRFSAGSADGHAHVLGEAVARPSGGRSRRGGAAPRRLRRRRRPRTSTKFAGSAPTRGRAARTPRLEIRHALAVHAAACARRARRRRAPRAPPTCASAFTLNGWRIALDTRR